MLTNLLTDKDIKTKVEADSWQEVGRLAGQILVDKGAVEPHYPDAMLAAVEKLGMYIVIAPGIALFHGRPEDGVNSVGLSMVTLKDGVNFGVKDKDPVRLAFALAAIDHDAHLNLLAALSKVLQDQEVVHGLMEAESPQQAIALIENKFSREV